MLSDSDPTRINCLPDPLLGRIFAAAGRQAGAAIPLVSRHWGHVFFSEAALWRSLALTASSLHEADQSFQAGHQWFAAKASLLRRVGGFVQQLCYSQRVMFLVDYDEGLQAAELLDMQQRAAASGSGWRLGSSVLAHLSPATLQSLELEWVEVDAAAGTALRSLTGLTQLKFICHGRVPDPLVAALPSLAQLQRLELSSIKVTLPTALPAALQQLAQLTALHCKSNDSLPDLSAVLPLSQLRRLEWLERRQVGVLQLDWQQALAQLPSLEDWTVTSYSRDLHHCSLQAGDAVLESCSATGCNRAGGTLANLQLADIRTMPSLQRLAAAWLPPGWQLSALRCLSLFSTQLPLLGVQNCPFLAHLTRLQLSHCRLSDPDALAAFGALLHQAPALHTLAIHNCFHTQTLPQALVSHTGLLRLCLKHNWLEQLPAGPYLDTLESLDLTNNSWSAVPPALAAATNLTELSLADNCALVLRPADVHVLSRLPCLRRLCMDGTQALPSVLWRLFCARPHLELAEGSLNL